MTVSSFLTISMVLIPQRMKVKEQTGSGDAPSSPTPPSTPPPHVEQLRPVTPPLPPLNYFGVDTSPPRPGVAQGEW